MNGHYSSIEHILIGLPTINNNKTMVIAVSDHQRPLADNAIKIIGSIRRRCVCVCHAHESGAGSHMVGPAL
jgi:hypothetical protein